MNSIKGNGNIIGDNNNINNGEQERNRRKEFKNRILSLKDKIRIDFGESHWADIAHLTDSSDIIYGHEKLIKSMQFMNSDYDKNILDVLNAIASYDPTYILDIEEYILGKFPIMRQENDFISSSFTTVPSDSFTFSPNPEIFSKPNIEINNNLVSVMMPFKPELNEVFSAISSVCAKNGIECLRADDLWNNSVVIQEIFNLIYSSRVVICDFTGMNPNVFYECGLAHCLGKIVIPIAQNKSDVSFDLRHHRYIVYDQSFAGLNELMDKLEKRLNTLMANTGDSLE